MPTGISTTSPRSKDGLPMINAYYSVKQKPCHKSAAPLHKSTAPLCEEYHIASITSIT
jgi:hypothetical protein